MNVFNADNNKGMLWSLLDKQNKFNGVPSHVNIGEIFESHVKKTEIKCKGNESLVNMNKMFLASLLEDISIYTSPSLLKKNKTESFIESRKKDGAYATHSHSFVSNENSTSTKK